jgi:hypothetical protein
MSNEILEKAIQTIYAWFTKEVAHIRDEQRLFYKKYEEMKNKEELVKLKQLLDHMDDAS